MSTEPKSEQFSLTIPAAIAASIKEHHAGPLDLSTGEMVKHWLFAAWTQPGGVTIDLKPVVSLAMREHPELGLELK